MTSLFGFGKIALASVVLVCSQVAIAESLWVRVQWHDPTLCQRLVLTLNTTTEQGSVRLNQIGYPSVECRITREEIVSLLLRARTYRYSSHTPNLLIEWGAGGTESTITTNDFNVFREAQFLAWRCTKQRSRLLVGIATSSASGLAPLFPEKPPAAALRAGPVRTDTGNRR